MGFRPWYLRDLERVPAIGRRVFSTFACGGGSSMGYKRAGFTVTGACDIDPKVAREYVRNLHPPAFYTVPIRDLVSNPPPECNDLDILDGSPPCSTFSTGNSKRQGDLGKLRKFREGQAEQVLSDLFFDYLDLVEAVRPRVFVAENVTGILKGSAKGYVRAIYDRATALGYRTQLFQVNAADCGVPQRRERVFFVSTREPHPPLVLRPAEPWVTAAEALADVVLIDAERDAVRLHSRIARAWLHTPPGENLSEACKQLEGKYKLWNYYRIRGDAPSNTLAAHVETIMHWSEPRTLAYREWLRLGGFPDDYEADNPQRHGRYLIGMSVPPPMMEVVARAIAAQWFAS